VGRLPALAAGLLAVAGPLSAIAQTAEKIAVLVMPHDAGQEDGRIAERTRQLIIARLARHGCAVRDAGGAAVPAAGDDGAGSDRLQIRTDIRRIERTYTRQATLSITATLLDGTTGQRLARLRAATAAPWRVPEDCTESCFDRLAYRQAEPLVVGLAAGIATRLTRLAGDRALPPADARILAFHGIAPGMAAEVERYLRAVPGIADVRREPVAARELVFRYRLAGASDRTEDSLHRMMRHLRLDGEVTRRGMALVVDVAAVRDW
jgi:hypothetical protein